MRELALKYLQKRTITTLVIKRILIKLNNPPKVLQLSLTFSVPCFQNGSKQCVFQ
jgi:hypothetical protein